jgi:hypothetical protein
LDNWLSFINFTPFIASLFNIDGRFGMQPSIISAVLELATLAHAAIYYFCCISVGHLDEVQLTPELSPKNILPQKC